jgi:major membrane immunogen (membrane-anchored lipoprotein)
MKKTLLILVAIVFAVTACDKQTYVDGTYTATFDAADDRGWNSVVVFTLTEDVISNVDFDDFDAEDNRKSEDEAYNDRMQELTGVTNPGVFTPQIEAAIENAEIVPTYVAFDAITGATGSSGNANALVEAALEAAVTGEETEISIARPTEE